MCYLWMKSDMNFTGFRELGSSSSLAPCSKVRALLVLNCRSGRTCTLFISFGGVAASTCWMACFHFWMASFPLQVIWSLGAKGDHKKGMFICSARVLIEGILSASGETGFFPGNENKHCVIKLQMKKILISILPLCIQSWHSPVCYWIE